MSGTFCIHWYTSRAYIRETRRSYLTDIEITLTARHASQTNRRPCVVLAVACFDPLDGISGQERIVKWFEPGHRTAMSCNMPADCKLGRGTLYDTDERSAGTT